MYTRAVYDYKYTDTMTYLVSVRTRSCTYIYFISIFVKSDVNNPFNSQTTKYYIIKQNLELLSCLVHCVHGEIRAFTFIRTLRLSLF